MSEPSYGQQARWGGQSHAAKAIKQSQALGIISLQWCTSCTSQNIKWSLKPYLKCLSHFPGFPRSSSDFLFEKKNLRQSLEKNESHTMVSGIILPDWELWCQLGATATVLSVLPARLLSPETPAHFTVSYLMAGGGGWWGLMGRLGIFKAQNINYLAGVVWEWVWERKEMQVLEISSNCHLWLKWNPAPQKAGCNCDWVSSFGFPFLGQRLSQLDVLSFSVFILCSMAHGWHDPNLVRSKICLQV